MKTTKTLAILLVAISLGGLAIGLAYRSHAYSNTRQAQTAGTIATVDEATSIAQQFLATTRNPNLAIKEIMEFQNNFCITYYEQDTGRGAFEMIIWKQAPSQGMGTGFVTLDVIMPEVGPNVMWNTKYSVESGQVVMKNQNYVSSDMISKEKALQIGQAYLDSNLDGARVVDATQFYGYYRIDYTVNGKIAGMLSVFSYTGQGAYYSWHGGFVQEAQF
jgi:hypothetical protein